MDNRSRKTSRRIVDFDLAKKKLGDLTEYITLLEYGGKTTASSLFYNDINNRLFTTSLHGLIQRLRKGEDLSKIGIGTGGEKLLASEKVQKKVKKTLRKKYGVDNPSQIPEVQQKIKNTFRERYNVDHPSQIPEVQQKFRKTMQEKYGVDNPSQIPEVKQKKKETAIKNGHIQLFEGRTRSEWAEHLGVGYSTFQSTLKEKGLEEALSRRPREPYTETKLLNSFEEYEIIHNRKLEGTKYRPDLFFPQHNLIIECDGLYWHSEVVIDNRSYHAEKRRAYIEQGLTPLFFREDEIHNKYSIVHSMILHRLGESNRIGARQTTIDYISKEQAKTFFNENHLMGNGSGKSIGLIHEDNLVSAIQFRKRKSGMEISRYCTKLNTVVIGGLSKLLKHSINTFNVTHLDSFCDLRYGNPKHLEGLGFQHVNTDLSFRWTDGHRTYHRMKFPGNSGYNRGLYKIWDCGQALYRLGL